MDQRPGDRREPRQVRRGGFERRRDEPRGTGTEVVDAGGMTVVPGFIDAHCHPNGMRDLFEVNLDVRTIEDIKLAIRAAAADTRPGFWVDGFKYDDTKVTDENGQYRRITRHDLDEATTDVPVRVSHRGGHIYWYNSKAFEMAGVTKDVADPPGGRFEKDANGELTGLVEEKADDVFDGVGQRRVYGRTEYRQGVAHMSKLMTAAGITGVHQTGGDSDGLLALEDAYAAGELRYRMYYFASADTALHTALKEARIHRGFGNEWLRIGAIKYGADGSASRTHHVHEHPVRGHRRPRHPHHDPRGDHGGGRGLPRARLPHRDPRERRPHHRLRARRLREGARRGPQGRPPPHRALLAGEPGAAGPDPGHRFHPHPVLDLRPLPREQVGGVRRGEDEVDVRPQVLPRLRHPGCRSVRLRARDPTSP